MVLRPGSGVVGAGRRRDASRVGPSAVAPPARVRSCGRASGRGRRYDRDAALHGHDLDDGDEGTPSSHLASHAHSGAQWRRAARRRVAPAPGLGRSRGCPTTWVRFDRPRRSAPLSITAVARPTPVGEHVGCDTSPFRGRASSATATSEAARRHAAAPRATRRRTATPCSRTEVEVRSPVLHRFGRAQAVQERMLLRSRIPVTLAVAIVSAGCSDLLGLGGLHDLPTDGGPGDVSRDAATTDTGRPSSGTGSAGSHDGSRSGCITSETATLRCSSGGCGTACCSSASAGGCASGTCGLAISPPGTSSPECSMAGGLHKVGDDCELDSDCASGFCTSSEGGSVGSREERAC